jgi:ActR/RegA family two-component response regulator
MAESRDVCQRLGVQEYLTKPADPEDLLKAVARALAAPATDEQFMVVTVRLPASVLQTLMDVDENLERAITRVCNECAGELKKLSRTRSQGA